MTDTPEIGPTVQKFRKDRGLTLEQLADSSGVSKSMLSQIERGQANPTFAVLWGLTRALGIDISALVEGASTSRNDDGIEVVSTALTPEIKNTEGSCAFKILSPPNMAGEIEWYQLRIDADGALDSAAHAPGTQEHFTAFSGRFQITSGGSTVEISAGETARYKADIPHRIKNMESTEAEGLLVVQFAN